VIQTDQGKDNFINNNKSSMINQNIYQKLMKNDFQLNRMQCMIHNLMIMYWINKTNNKCFLSIQEEGTITEQDSLILNSKEIMAEEESDLKESMVKIITTIKIQIWKNYKIKCLYNFKTKNYQINNKIINLTSFCNHNKILILHQIL